MWLDKVVSIFIDTV
ncbi:unnamed protein product, partial [Rotaria sp. Silwood2]